MGDGRLIALSMKTEAVISATGPDSITDVNVSPLIFSVMFSSPFPLSPPLVPAHFLSSPALSSAFLTHSSLSTCVLSLLLQTLLLTQQSIVKKVLKHYIPVNTTKMNTGNPTSRSTLQTKKYYEPLHTITSGDMFVYL